MTYEHSRRGRLPLAQMFAALLLTAFVMCGIAMAAQPKKPPTTTTKTTKQLAEELAEVRQRVATLEEEIKALRTDLDSIRKQKESENTPAKPSGLGGPSPVVLQPNQRGAQEAGGGEVVFGVTDQNPVVLLQPENGMSIHLSSATYDQFGRIESYEAKVGNGQQSRTIKVHQKELAQKGKPAEYVAEVDGKEIPTLKGADGSGAIGFTLKDQGGAILAYVGTLQINMKTELGYDKNGRPHVKRQTFSHGGKNLDITYSEHSYDKFGRLTGYKVQIQKAS